jgi:hypothetical protein
VPTNAARKVVSPVVRAVGLAVLLLHPVQKYATAKTTTATAKLTTFPNGAVAMRVVREVSPARMASGLPVFPHLVQKCVMAKTMIVTVVWTKIL